MRRQVKRALARAAVGAAPKGCTVLTYHRVGGGSPDERDVRTADFAEQVARLRDVDVVPLAEAVARLAAGDERPSVVLTFDDGFRDVHDNAFPLMAAAGLPFTLYLATGFVGATMHWDGSTARDTGAPALDWAQVDDLVASGLCTLGNHTHDHVRPELVTVDQLDRCTDAIAERTGAVPVDFAYTWGIPVPRLSGALAERFRTAVTGEVGRNRPGADPMALRRVPVRGTDPVEFFQAKISGTLLAERAYSALVSVAKRAGASA